MRLSAGPSRFFSDSSNLANFTLTPAGRQCQWLPMKLPQLSLRDLFWLVALAAMCCGCSSQHTLQPPVTNQKLSHIYAALEQSPELYLYSLSPTEVKEGEHLAGWRSMGRVRVEGESRTQLVNAFKAATKNKIPTALCFEPHHGIRVTDGESDTDLVICFTCRHLEVHAGVKREFYSIDETAWPLFSRLLKEAKLPYEDMPNRP